MPVSGGTHSYSSLLEVSDDDSGTVFVGVGEVKRVTAPPLSTSDTKFTHLNSPSAAEEYRAGMIEAGEVSLNMNYVQADYNRLRGYVVARKTKTWRLTLPLVGAQTVATKITWTGHVKSLPLEIPEDGAVVSDNVTIKVSGLPTIALGS
jgi:hypothetical protein